VTPGTLLYAKGGYTNARLNLLGGDGTTSLDENYELDGWRVGAGVERAIGTNAFAKIEYRYSNYESANFEYADGATTSDFDVDTDRHQVVAGLGWRF
jgi:outer membrane immunogenic protein